MFYSFSIDTAKNIVIFTAQKVFVYGAFWSEYGKLRTRKIPNTDTVHAVFT